MKFPMATKVDVLLNVLNSEQDFSDWIIYDYNYLLAGTGHCQLCGKKHIKHEFTISNNKDVKTLKVGSSCALKKIDSPKLHYSMKEVLSLSKKLDKPFMKPSRNNSRNYIKKIDGSWATLVSGFNGGFELYFKNVKSDFVTSEEAAKKDWIKKFIKTKLQSKQFNELSPQYMKLSKLSEKNIAYAVTADQQIELNGLPEAQAIIEFVSSEAFLVRTGERFRFTLRPTYSLPADQFSSQKEPQTAKK
ncbi:hypothetical protein HUU53_05035 [Candidatus Micrarchaeota archaeon]|nr:hypothetical protein [Candidatus Micrarchaeota archaeon]